MKQNIPSAGPWITEKEISYVTDAVQNGWYENWSGYIDRFEKAFAEYIGVKHAISTSSCTGALHIALRALEIGPGDEVIAPEVSWVATVTNACHLGAKPVFVDVLMDTWCLDPDCVEKAITPRTKAIISVDMFGHPADKDRLMDISKSHNIPIIEDAAPGIGSEYKGKKVGSFGLAGAFSLQGAKPLVTGEGGVLVTDSDEFYERCHYFADHCREPGKVLFNSDIGFKYKMSNIQAALGLAQLERANEIVAKRRQIFFWYRDRLEDIAGLRMNVEPEGCFNNFYVPTIIVDPDLPVTATELMDGMNEQGYANRPFFRPISKFPMFDPAETPVADYLAANGINLPCATTMTEDQVDLVASYIKKRLVG